MQCITKVLPVACHCFRTLISAADRYVLRCPSVHSLRFYVDGINSLLSGEIIPRLAPLFRANEIDTTRRVLGHRTCRRCGCRCSASRPTLQSAVQAWHSKVGSSCRWLSPGCTPSGTCSRPMPPARRVPGEVCVSSGSIRQHQWS